MARGMPGVRPDRCDRYGCCRLADRAGHFAGLQAAGGLSDNWCDSRCSGHTATEVGSLTVACGPSPADAGVHLPCDRMYVAKPLPPGLMLFGYGELRKKG